MIFILDEWIIEDLRGINKEEKQKQSFLFLEKNYQKCDKIVVVENSKFFDKIWKLSEEACNDILKKKIIAFIKSYFLYNKEKSYRIDLSDIENVFINNMDDLNYILKDVNPDDHYIVKAYFYLSQKNQNEQNKQNKQIIIITTDEPLKEILQKFKILVYHRDQFIHNY
ncbi:MAG: hypothetical protein ACP5RD_04295 [bacterium]